MAKGLIKKDPRDIAIGGFTLTAKGLVANKGATIEDWQSVGAFIERVERGVQWWIGDWLNHGEGRPEWGDKYEQAISMFNRDYESLRQYKQVSAAIEIGRRLPNLSWSHHQAVAYLPPEKQEELLDEAEPDEEGKEPRLSVADLRKRVRKERDSVPPPPLPQSRFNLIYADPPWRYDFSKSDSRKIENQYPTMEIEDICALPIAGIAAPDTVLFLWATSPKLTEAMAVISRWGFEYKTCMIWRKDKIGMGYYARQQHELLLIATCGTPSPPPERSRPPSVIDGTRDEHSRKPDVFYGLIEQMYPDAKKVELFCRRPRDGWKAWGNEV